MGFLIDMPGPFSTTRTYPKNKNSALQPNNKFLNIVKHIAQSASLNIFTHTKERCKQHSSSTTQHQKRTTYLSWPMSPILKSKLKIQSWYLKNLITLTLQSTECKRSKIYQSLDFFVCQDLFRIDDLISLL